MENQVILALKNNKLLKNILFDDLNFENIKGQLLTKSEGEILFRESDNALSLYLVVSGEINLLKKRDSKKTESFVFGENDFFGADEFLLQGKRKSTAVVLRDSYIIALSKPEVDNLIEQSDEIIANIYESVDTDEETRENVVDGAGEIADLISTESDFPQTPVKQPVPKSAGDISFEGFEDVDIILGPDTDFEDDSILDPIATNDNSLSNDSPDLSHDDFLSANTPGKTDDDLSLNDNTVNFNLDSSIPELEPELDASFELPPVVTPEDNIISEDSNILVPEKTVPVKEKAPEKPAPVIEKTIPGGSYNLAFLEKINDAAQLVNSNIKIDVVLQNIVKVATELTNADRGTLYLLEKDKNELWSKIALGTDFKEIKLKIGEGIAGWVAAKGETINIENAHEDPRFNVNFDKTSGYVTKSMMCFPIKNRNRDICGVLQLLNSKNGKFSEVDEELLEALSIHAAMALQNAELVEQLLKGERISSLGKMANFLIQDIKKPVMVSKRYTEHLKTKEMPAESSKVIDMLLEQLDHIAELVNSTSNYSEGQIVSRSHLRSLNEVLEDYVARVNSLVRSKNCTISHEFANDVKVEIAEKQLFQSFQHIVKNACEAMPEGGEIVIVTENTPGNVTLSIKDSGLGIPEMLHEKIFEPFMSHGKKEGTGLGLAITKKIIEEHGGSISVISEIGEGAQFIITLPIVST